jgi:hypothetical protein
MSDISDAKELLDEINTAISSYDPVLKEKARDILLERAFGSSEAATSGGSSGQRARGRPRSDASSGGREDAGDLASLLTRWSPTTMSDKALLGAYYLTRARGEDTVTSQAINSELKRNGLAISNITRAIEANMRPDRPLMVQEKKMGSTKQARKQYRITPAGVETVERKLQG